MSQRLKTKNPGTDPRVSFGVHGLRGLAHEIGVSTFGREIHCIWRCFRGRFVGWRQADRLCHRERFGLDPIADQGQHAEEGGPDDEEIRQYWHPHGLTVRHNISFS